MFRKQKKTYRIYIYAAIIFVLCVLIGILFWPQEVQAPASTQTPTEDSNVSEKVVSSEDKTENIPEITDITEEFSTYYIIKRDGDIISIYFSDGTGNIIKLESTNILYELLPPDDQEAFEKGIEVDSQDELYSLLQDFES
jgi:hypothetical protein